MNRFLQSLPLTLLLACQAVESDVGLFHPDLLEAMTQSPIHAELPEAEDVPVFVSPHTIEAAWPSIGGDQEVELNLRGTTLREALNTIAEQAGVNIVLEGNLDIPVHASFPKVKVDDALRSLLTQHDLRLVQDSAGIFSVTSTDGTAQVTAAIPLQSIAAADVAEQLASLAGESRIVVDTSRNVVLVDGDQKPSIPCGLLGRGRSGQAASAARGHDF